MMHATTVEVTGKPILINVHYFTTALVIHSLDQNILASVSLVIRANNLVVSWINRLRGSSASDLFFCS